MEKIEPIWTVVGNIVEKRINGQDGKEYFGTKHFAPNTKVYIVLTYSGICENVVVIGKARKSKHLIRITLNINYIHNFRAKLCYNPAVLRKMDDLDGLLDEESAKGFAKSFPIWQEDTKPKNR